MEKYFVGESVQDRARGKEDIAMAVDQRRIQHDLTTFNFKTLFIEELGWDTLREAPLAIPIDGQTYMLRPLVEKRGFKVYLCSPDTQGRLPNSATMRQIERELTRHAYEHLIIYVDAAQESQVWQWVRREPGKPLAPRLYRLHKGQSGELLSQKLLALAFSIEEEDSLGTTLVAARVRQALIAEHVTKKFYDRFQKEHAAFLTFIEGIISQTDREWYASLMLNRLMFVYFIEKKGLLATSGRGELDGDRDYLSHKLKEVQVRYDNNQFYSFYRQFLLRLFHEGLGRRERSPELEALLGNVPYLNGGLFEVHILEHEYPDIQIADNAFERIFAFFNEFDWHLDDRPLRNDREINPDVLGYIFEKYINQKQMGAYYTKEDITGYISKNTIIPRLLEETEQKCLIAFTPGGFVWSLLRRDPDRYIYEAVKKGCDLPLPPEIKAGIHDVSQRDEWNKPAPQEYALPTEIWREVVVRRTRYEEVREKLASGAITSVNDLITYNLDITHFAQDVITYSEGVDLLNAFYASLETITILDPTCGSGAFLFAALNILEPLYEACLDRMQEMVAERERLDALSPPHSAARPSSYIPRFRDILKQVAKHPNRRYFILKSIIINNLYGVDIMEEAVEICKLRLFLKLVAQIERFVDIEPLPDIDFNIRAGNTLVGFASQDELVKAIEYDMRSTLTSNEAVARIEQKALAIERDFNNFRDLQIRLEPADLVEIKQQIRDELDKLRNELDRYLASEYGIDHSNIPNKEEYEERFIQWRQSHQPFHWWIEFYGIMKQGGFDVIIGNPPYVEYSEVRSNYRLLENQYATISTGNLYAFTWERVLRLIKSNDWVSLIIPISSFSTPRMEAFVSLTKSLTKDVWLSQYAVRPSKLFVGVDMNLTIVISRAADHDISARSHFWTTMYQRWTPNFRGFLFANISYVDVPDEPLPFNFAIPKLREGFEERLLRKIYSNQPVSKLISPHRIQTTQQLSYRTAGGRYYKIFLDRSLDSESKSNKTTSLREDVDVRCVLAVLSSNLWWWYYTLHFDMYNCKDYMIFGFPFSYPANFEILDSLRILGKILVDDLFKNAESKIQDYATTGARKQLIFVPSRSKPIIDEIDRVLARHYGFTDEEVDFIINYDIKYRMGRGDEEDRGE